MENLPPRRDGNDRQMLNPVDRALSCVDRALRGMGYPGFETQMLVWLSGRVDAAKLHGAIGRLSRRHPTAAARLVSTGRRDQASLHWQLRRGTECALQQTELASAEDAAVLAFAGQLLSTPNDPAEADPIRFHLLRRPDGRDVLLTQYNHVLMDNNASGLLLREIDALAQATGGEADEEESPSARSSSVLARYLRRFPRSRRREAVQRAIHRQGRVLRGRAVIIGTGAEQAPRPPRLRIITRSLTPDQTRVLHSQVVRICGFPSLSMAVLACVFRGIEQLAPADRKAGRNYVAGIGLDLNLRGREGPFFQNLMSLMPISAPAGEVGDRDELMRSLSREFRDSLESDIDLGVLQLAMIFSRRSRYIEWVVEHLLRYGYSLWYAYFGSLDSVGRRFCGTDVERITYAGPTWSPVGITLLVNQYGGRMHFQATYDPELVSDALANAFLETVIADLPG